MSTCLQITIQVPHRSPPQADDRWDSVVLVPMKEACELAA